MIEPGMWEQSVSVRARLFLLDLKKCPTNANGAARDPHVMCASTQEAHGRTLLVESWRVSLASGTLVPLTLGAQWTEKTFSVPKSWGKTSEVSPLRATVSY